ncbi:MAG: hypothetical protein IJA12_05275 [Oscillospiraceae bacterium]|nr:hypothetical protein [Oscillospiraceae bacterium]
MKDNKYVKELQEKLLAFCKEIKKIYLISVKVDTMGELTSFKFGLIVEDSILSTSELAGNLYFNIDCELPFDLVIYTQQEFDSLKDEIGTFAYKINKSGTVLYG